MHGRTARVSSVIALASSALRLPPRQRREPSPLATLIAARAPEEGTTLTSFAGMCFYRVTKPVRYKKSAVVAPRLIVIAQGRKIARFEGGELAYDEDHFLVVTGETTLEGHVLEASPERPYLAMCMELAPDVVARTLLALADADPDAARSRKDAAPALPAFVSRLDAPVTNAVARLLVSLDDPIERQVIAPLAVEELVFRLLRTDGAAIVRGAVREGDGSIQLAMRYIRANAARPLTVEGVARHVGMSPSHFAHRFTEVARVSPMRFVKHVRLDAARELLLADRVRVGEVALRVGYESASHFTRDFKQTYGAAPAEYLRRFRDGASA
jgi:AraC-like DNA-binding protein